MNQENTSIEERIVRFLDGTIDPAEKAELLAWLESAEENREQFVDFYKLWSCLALQHGPHKKEEAFEAWMKRYRRREPVSRSRTLRLFAYSGAAAAMACLVVFSILNFFRPEESALVRFARENAHPADSITEIQLRLSEERTVLLTDKQPAIRYTPEAVRVEKADTISRQASAVYNELIVPYGKRTLLTLSDGSTIWVNAGSRLIYPFAFENDKREIYIEGEAYLEVTPDKKRPFTVKTKEMEVRVLGTKFNVSAYENEAEQRVVLVEGSVEAGRADRKKNVVLKPDQLYTLSGGNESVSEVDVTAYISWVHGLYVFESEPLPAILSRLTRYYGINIGYEPSLGQTTCSGKLDLKDDLQELLRGLADAIPAGYRQLADGSYFFYPE